MVVVVPAVVMVMVVPVPVLVMVVMVPMAFVPVVVAVVVVVMVSVPAVVMVMVVPRRLAVAVVVVAVMMVVVAVGHGGQRGQTENQSCDQDLHDALRCDVEGLAAAGAAVTVAAAPIGQPVLLMLVRPAGAREVRRDP